MTLYRTTLTRTFIVVIEANNEKDAMQLAEHFVGHLDGSRPHEKEEFKFEIKHIEMTENEALEAEPIEKDDKFSEFLD